MTSQDKPNQTNCPYCHATLYPVPTRKKKCLSCGQYIYVKTRPSDRLRVLVTDEGAKQIDSEWNQIQAEQNIKRMLDGFRINQKELEAEGKQLSRNFGHPASTRDTIWAILNRRSIELIKRKDWQQLSSLYYSLAMFLHDEGKDCFHLLQESRRCELKNYQRIGYSKVSIWDAGDSSCAKCQALNGKEFTISDALKVMPIPVANCDNTYGFCRCTYSEISD